MPCFLRPVRSRPVKSRAVKSRGMSNPVPWSTVIFASRKNPSRKIPWCLDPVQTVPFSPVMVKTRPVPYRAYRAPSYNIPCRAIPGWDPARSRPDPKNRGTGKSPGTCETINYMVSYIYHCIIYQVRIYHVMIYACLSLVQ